MLRLCQDVYFVKTIPMCSMNETQHDKISQDFLKTSYLQKHQFDILEVS